MATVDDIRLDNLNKSIARGEKFLISGIVASALFLLISADTLPFFKGESPSKISIPGLGELSHGKASIILIFLYLIFGLLINASLGRAITMVNQIEKELATASLEQFSFFTIRPVFLRFVVILFPSILMLIAYIFEIQGKDTKIKWEGILGLLVWSSPYIYAAARLWQDLSNKTRIAQIEK